MYAMLDVGRKALCYGLEGIYVMGRKAFVLWAGRHCGVDRKVDAGKTGRFTGLGRKSSETHGPEGHGLERRMCVSSILGNSLSIYSYSCCVVCFRYQ